jgi:hypothetical protein
VGTPSCACGKKLFYDNSAGFGGNSGQFIMKKIPNNKL